MTVSRWSEHVCTVLTYLQNHEQTAVSTSQQRPYRVQGHKDTANKLPDDTARDVNRHAVRIQCSNKEGAGIAIAIAHSRCSAERSVSARKWTMPRTPFRGVRISWLMFACAHAHDTRQAHAGQHFGQATSATA